MIVSSATNLWSVLLIGFVWSQPFDEGPRYSWLGKLSSYPKKFEIRSSNANQAKTHFEKLATQMHHLAKSENATVIYKVKVQMLPGHKRSVKKKWMKNGLSKKFNVPLKKNSLRLSQFESILRKVAEVNVQHAALNPDVPTSTAASRKNIMSTRQMTLKYRPIPSKLSNYAKIIRPVKKRVITLS